MKLRIQALYLTFLKMYSKTIYVWTCAKMSGNSRIKCFRLKLSGHELPAELPPHLQPPPKQENGHGSEATNGSN